MSGESCPRTWGVPGTGCQVWVLGFMQERIQQWAIVKWKHVYLESYIFQKQNTVYLRKWEDPWEKHIPQSVDRLRRREAPGYLVVSFYVLRCSVFSDSCTSWTVAHHAPLSMRFSQQEHWSGVPFPPPGDLPDAEIDPHSSYTGRRILYHYHHLGRPSVFIGVGNFTGYVGRLFKLFWEKSRDFHELGHNPLFGLSW